MTLASRSPTSLLLELLAGRGPNAAADGMQAVRCSVFVAAHLVTAVAGFAALPLFLLFAGVPGPAESLVFVAFLAPLATALVAARTGRPPQLLSLAGNLGLIGAAGLAFGAAALPFLAVIPAQAALGGSGRMMLASLAAACALPLLLLFAPEAADVGGRLLVGAVVAATLLVAFFVGAQLLLQASAERWANGAEERAGLVAAVPDLVTRHDPSGRVTFASMPASRRLLGVGARDLAGDGLLARVQVADRPAYLSALARARDGAPGAATELRLGGGSGDGPLAYAWFEMRCEPLGEQLACSFRDIDERKRTEAEAGEDTAGTVDFARIGEHLRALRRDVDGGADAVELRRRLDRLALLADVSAGEPLRSIEAFDCGLAVRGACDAAVPLARSATVALNGPPLQRLPKVAGAPAAFRQALGLLLDECIGCAGAGGEVAAALDRGADSVRIGLAYLTGIAGPGRAPDLLAVELASRLLATSGAILSHEDRPGHGGRFSIRITLRGTGARPAGTDIIGQREYGVAKRA